MITKLAAATTVIVLSIALLPVSAWSEPSQRLYAWGAPFTNNMSHSQYFGATPISGIPGKVVQISASNSASYALTSTGEVWAWGAGEFGALGNGTVPSYQPTPVKVALPSGVVIASLPSPMPYAAGMAIDTKGNVWGWGSNYRSPLCLSTQNILTPRRLPLTHVTLATGAGWHGLYNSNGKVYACGGNKGGELGDGTTVSSTKPVLVVGLPKQPVRSLQSSWENSGALMANGAYYNWGYNAADQLGDGTTTNSDRPVLVRLQAPVAQISLGGSAANNGQTGAILTDGSFWAWGSDQYGQLGNGKLMPSSGPTGVHVPKGVTFVDINSGGATMYGVDATGAAWSWGQNNDGQRGIGIARPAAVPGRLAVELSCISSTAANTAGLRKDTPPAASLALLKSSHRGTGCEPWS